MKLKTYKLKDAKAKGLVQLSTWEFAGGSTDYILTRMYTQVMKNKGRIAMVVCNDSGRLALFVNNVIEIKKNFRKYSK